MMTIPESEEQSCGEKAASVVEKSYIKAITNGRPAPETGKMLSKLTVPLKGPVPSTQTGTLRAEVVTLMSGRARFPDIQIRFEPRYFCWTSFRSKVSSTELLYVSRSDGESIFA